MASTTTLDRRGQEGATGPSDAELLDRVRAGDSPAYGLLYERHQPAATSLARYLTHSGHDADDVVADAFARVLRAIKGGHGPTEAFRPYLLTAVRRTVWRKSEDARHHRLAADDDEAELLDIRLAVEPEDRSDEALILRAFGELPERWQTVLWHTEIEGQPPASVAPILGLSPNATAALAVRAREGLRQAYLQAHLQARPAEGCQFTVEHLGAYVRDGLGKRDTAKVEEHLQSCESCADLLDDLGSLNKVLRNVVGPAVLGAGAAQWLAGRAAESSSATATSSGAQAATSSAHRGLRFQHAVALAGAAAVVLVGLGLPSPVARRDADEPATPIEPAAAIRDEPVGDQVVAASLAGTPGRSPGVVRGSCQGPSLPLSLPEGATPTGAALVEAPASSGDQPSLVEPSQADQLQGVHSSSTTLVGDDGACVSTLIGDLADAPANTALAVTFLDQLGQLHILLVPQIVPVVQDALQTVTDSADAVTATVLDYLHQLQQAFGGLPGANTAIGGGTGSGSGGSGGGTLPGGVDVPDIPGVDVPDLPALPPAPSTGGGSGNGGVGGVVDGVGDVVDDVTGAVGGVLGH